MCRLHGFSADVFNVHPLLFQLQLHLKMSARGAPAASPAAPAPPDMPDLSHLTEEERKIILSVMDRQKKEEEKEQSMLK